MVEFVDAAKASGQKNAIANLSLDLTQKNADGIVTTRYELTTAERSAIEYARQNGVMLVVAAGNDGGVMSVLGQASQEFDNIFTVGAGDINGRSDYSSYGRGLDIVADGGTTEHPGLSTVGNDLGTMAGTSVATGKVAGAASLVWAANPALNYRQVMEILKSTARDLGPSGWDDETGFGFLNTLAAVDLAKKTKPEVYKPTAFLKPTTWGGEGLVTPTERAVNIINENFTAWVVSSNGITLRNSPNTSDRSNFVVKTGDTLTFDGWTYGEQLSDLTTGKADALWYRFRYNGGTYWVPSAWTGGYPGSKPPLLPPTQQPPQQPPQQPTANTVYLSTSSGQILQVNTATGTQNPIYQGRAFTDLAVAPNGKLYGCTFYDGLYEINPSTGAERYVGPLAGGTLNSLTFSPDGRLYGADQGNGNLFQISPDNGQMNLIGNLGGPSSGDLVFNGTNEIFATVSSPNTSLNDRLVAFNLATGNSRYIGDLGLLEVYGLSWENGQLTAYTSDRRKLAIDPNTAKATVVGTVSSNGLIWGAATKPATASSPTDDVRQKFLYAASLYPQVGAAITGMQDQGGGVFRQEFERAIMIWNGQQVTVYETKGRSASPTSPSPNPQPVSGKGVTIRTGANGGTLIGGGGISGIKPTLDWFNAKIKQLVEDINKNQKEIDILTKIPFWELWPGNKEKISQLERQQKELEETRQGKDEFEKNNAHYIRMQKWTDEDWKRETSQETSINRVNSDINKLYAELSGALVGNHYSATVGYIYDTDYYQQYGIPLNIGHHDGIDIDTPNTPGQTGTPVKVLVGGTVRKLSYSGGSTGFALVVAGDDGRYYHYIHLSSSDVTSGRIEAGQTIGYVGNTNVAAFSHHLHFQVNKTAKTDEGGGNPSPPAYNIHSQSDVANWTLNPLKVFFDLKWQGNP
ncbi:S8 family serine peptidase [Microcoleus sp.]|uniref:S8 family serine peptidase n=1 Tax=Microcoleus sp. TaxID=44472 RepID=UPI003525A7FE